LGYSGYVRPEKMMPQALEAATRALTLDPTSTEGHCALGNVALLWERDFAKAEREFLTALSLNPQYIQARCWYGLFFLQWSAGRMEEGLAEAERASEADPLSSYATMVRSMAIGTVGRAQEGETQARIAVEQDPESFVAIWHWGNSC